MVVLIKIAKKYNINYKENVAEIPAIMLKEEIPIDTERLKFPFSDEAVELFGVQ